VPTLREVVEGARARKVVDPRFGDRFGNFSKAGFRKRYEFLFDEVMQQDKRAAQQQSRKARNPKRKERLERKVGHIDREIRKERQRRRQDRTDGERAARTRELVQQGKRPKYVSKAKRKKEALVEQFHELKKKGKLEEFMAKRRKKNAAKDHKQRPFSRRG